MVFTGMAFDNNTPASPLGAISAEHSVADVLRRRILRGELEVGAHLRQSEIAKDLGVSTTPVREALRSLTAEGLVAIDTNRGAVIRKLSDEELVEILELQLIVEASAARSAIPRMDARTLERASSIHEEMRQTTDATEWALLNREFHLTLTAPAGKPRTHRLLRELLSVSTIQLREDIDGWEGRRAQGELDHARFIELARAGEVDRTVALIEAHTGAAIAHRRSVAD
jgi:DNA-binding GntR family transcriptional regulator